MSNTYVPLAFGHSALMMRRIEVEMSKGTAPAETLKILSQMIEAQHSADDDEPTPPGMLDRSRKIKA